MKADLIIVIGAYGSGKSEYSINLAENYRNEIENTISLVDLDVVNPYFRSRDVREYFTEKGINVISPEGEYAHADLPMISPRIAGAVSSYDQTVILDVGGDPSGCRALARFTEAVIERGYKMHFVVNTLRPFTGSVAGILEMLDMLEASSKLKITELISNSNLLDETEVEHIESGIKMLEEVAKIRDITFDKYLVLDKMENKIRDGLGGKQRMIMRYYLSKPWERLTITGI